MSAGFPTIGQTPQPRRAVTSGVADREQELAALRPLMSELLAHDLVARSPSGTFQLQHDVQAHLELVAERNRTVAQVYIGRSCTNCGARTATTLIDGAQLCGVCRDTPVGTSPVDMAIRQSDSERHRTRLRRNHRAS